MELECTMDEQDAIVMDIGTRYLKVGFSGEDAPRAVISTCIAEATIDEAKEEDHDGQVAKKSTTFYGEEALRSDVDQSAQVWPITRGTVTNEDAMERLWDYTFRNVLEVEQLEDLPVLLADMPLNQMSKREWMTELFFEKFKVRSLGIFNSAVLSLYSTGLTRGLVVECGEGATLAVPVFEGYAIPHAIFKMEVAGQDITRKLDEMVRARGCAMNKDGRPPSLVTAQAMKEKLCCVVPDYEAACQGPDPGEEEARSFELPDGTIVQVPHDIRFGAPEQLFKRDASGAPDENSITSICKRAIETVDVDFQQDLVRSLVVSGGTSMLPGLSSRIATELSGVISADLQRQLEVVVDSQRKHGSWVGGSMLASLSTFDQLTITRSEFEEGKGENRGLVPRKTF